MTTVAWDGRSVAADTQSTCGNYRCPRGAYKLKRIGSCVYAATGLAALFEPMIEWHLAGADPSIVPQGEDEGFSLLVFEDGRCRMFRPNLPYADEFFAPIAFGAGDDFAIGAMHAGADARRAVEIAIICNPHTGGEVQVIDLTFQTLKAVA